MEHVYTIEEIKKLAPRYRGKPENFDPFKAKKGKASTPQDKPREGVNKPKQSNKTDNKTKSAELSPPERPQSAPIAVRNESILSEAIFGIGVIVTEIQPRQEFSASYRRIIDISQEMYQNYRADEKELDRILAKEELAYYATSILWMKLLEVKAKDRYTALSSEENALRKAIVDDTFNIPQPLFAYLSEIGTYTDKMGRETRHAVPPLPVTVIQGFGGYHAQAVAEDTHNLFEEVPSFGIAGDMVMALASADNEPAPNFRVGKPEGTVFTTNLVGNTTPIGPRRPEIPQRLAGYGITAAAFHEYVTGTRFNLKYVQFLSDLIGKVETFKIDKVQFRNLTASGGVTQVIKTRPTEQDDVKNWNERSVQALSAFTTSTANMGTAYCFGFQTYKEDARGENRMDRVRNWSCILQAQPNAWVMPYTWYQNRNDRRNLPDDLGTERCRANSMRQDLHLSNVLKRMI